jgi:DNA ligase-1
VAIRTRNDEECHFFDEIKVALKTLDLDPNVWLDGEFYSWKIPFRTLNGYCNRKKLDGKTGYRNIPREDLESIHYYLFDCYFIQDPQMPFEARYAYLAQVMSKNTSPYLHLVPNVMIGTEAETGPLHDQFVKEGYEGIMIRNLQSPYKLKDRSNDLLKLKHFSDEEFTIVGAQAPTTGKEEGCIIWELQVATSDLTFTCRPRDTYESRKADWVTYQADPSQFIGCQYTVRFQERYENLVPRFPVGIAIRYE